MRLFSSALQQGGWTSLMWATYKDSFSAVQLLLSGGAVIEAKDIVRYPYDCRKLDCPYGIVTCVYYNLLSSAGQL